MKKTFLGLAALIVASLALGAVGVGIAYVRDRDARLALLETSATRVETRLGPVEYALSGPAEGPVLAFLHGTPGGFDQAPPPRRDTRVLALSRPGYLGTPLASGETPAAQARLLAALLDVLGIERVVVMGASGGGPAAFEFARLFPQRTTALIAMEAVSGALPPDPEAPPLPASDLLLWLMLAGLEATQDAAGVVRTIFPQDPDLDRVLADPAITQEVAGLVWSMWPVSRRGAGMGNDLDRFADLDLDLEAIRVPTLVVHGTADDAVPFAHAERAAARIPGARLHAIEGGGHLLPFAHAEAVDRAVAAFLAPFAPEPGA